MQPIFLSFVSGVAYRKIVKLHFRSAMRFYLLVSIYENMLFQRFSSFLTAGNKSYCGILQHLTHPQQSTDSPIPEPVSSSKRQASQRKPFALSSTHAQTSSRLRKHRTSVPSRPQKLPGALIRTTSAPPMRPSHTPDTPQPHPRYAPATPTAEPPDAPLPPDPHSLPTPKSHVIPPGLYSPIARKPRNINDLISKPETPSGELRAKLLGSARVGPHRGHRAEAATHPDR